MGSILNKGYEPAEVEKRWYSFWESNGLFSADETEGHSNYSIVIPPPNVTGVLHMGHSLNITLQDILCRYRRLRGDNVLWMPGTDHAGIATQNVVERDLASKGIDRHQVGREKFIESVWEWRKKYGSAIINQLKRLGASCDWERERFTMDEGLSKAVRKVFVQLYEEGLIYRGNYIINWCPRCMTALADLEVEHDEHDGHIYHIHYPLVDGSKKLIVATTRPETMLGDTAVAVHPDDKRYRDLIGQAVELPLTGRQIPVIGDTYVDVEFGTGALKVTPAHDPNDFEIGRIHELPSVKVIGDDGLMTETAGQYKNMDRFDCRKRVVEDLKSQGLLDKIEDYRHSVGHCYRCQTTVEPNLSKQWFVRTKPLAAKAKEAVESEKTKIVPEKWKKDYFRWLNDIRDWCISRQIWWGHQIPAWTCESCSKIIVAMENPETCPDCKKNLFVQDEDVLDTWFSSALWPFSTLGWPDNTALLNTFYPTSVLVTGFDILFFWVARMMMMGHHFMADVPFEDVYVHALVRDEDGKKMSKSTGNVIDPMVIIEKYGTDALRMTLSAFAAQGRDIKLSEQRIEGYRHFVNKLWNAARFVLMNVSESDENSGQMKLSLPDRWILSRLKSVTKNVSHHIEGYRFNDATKNLYQFIWHEVCDWYLEAIKPALYGKKGEVQRHGSIATVSLILKESLILLHPFIPFVTEEIWEKLPATEGSIMKAVFPLDNPDFNKISSDPTAEQEMNIIMEIVTGIRNVRGEMNISPSKSLSVIVQSSDDSLRETVSCHEDMVINLGRLDNLKIEKSGDKPKLSATTIIGKATLFILLEGVIDISKEITRLEKEINKINGETEKLEAKLDNQNFIKKAPSKIVDKVKSQFEQMVAKKEQLLINLSKIKAI